eukprot:TRINITY_DN5089_c0_g1_i1.p1 TRINITY_DN5089_c0_g1~~TRINITY_DN5089_c0_g1_i1.p1  ORF type:complete len:415 (+),score=124.18 TRINITY_DN5089_c0_g1_i1:143-1387(+)
MELLRLQAAVVPSGQALRGGRRFCQSHTQRRLTDEFRKKAVVQGYRARSAFKLEQINERENLFNKQTRVVVDLGCSPGSWLQAASRMMEMEKYADHPSYKKRKSLIGIDLLPTEPVAGAQFLRGDFTQPEVQERMFDMVQVAAADMASPTINREQAVQNEMSVYIAENLPVRTGDYGLYHQGRNSELFGTLAAKELELKKHFIEQRRAVVDGVMSDMSPTQFAGGQAGQGVVVERAEQVALAETAKHFALKVLKPGGWFVTKVFNSGEAMRLYQSLSLYFKKTALLRPPAVRQDSIESFAVGTGFIGIDRLRHHEYATLTDENVMSLGSSTHQARDIRRTLGYNRSNNSAIIHPHEKKLLPEKPKRQRHTSRLRMQYGADLPRLGTSPIEQLTLDTGMNFNYAKQYLTNAPPTR